MKKGGQLTIFVIVAVVIVIGIASFYLVKDTFLNKPIEGSEVVKGSLVDCLEFSTHNALYIVAYQGGYNTAPRKNFSFSPTFFPYYYYEGANLMPSLDLLEEEMGRHVVENLGSCLNDINGAGFDLNYAVSSVDVEVTREGVEFVVDMPVVLSKGEETMIVDMKKFPVFHETKLLDIFEISKYFIEDQMEDPELYCISCINRMAVDAGINFYLFPILDDVVMVMAFEDKENPVTFNFVNKYSSSTGA